MLRLKGTHFLVLMALLLLILGAMPHLRVEAAAPTEEAEDTVAELKSHFYFSLTIFDGTEVIESNVLQPDHTYSAEMFYTYEVMSNDPMVGSYALQARFPQTLQKDEANVIAATLFSDEGEKQTNSIGVTAETDLELRYVPDSAVRYNVLIGANMGISAHDLLESADGAYLMTVDYADAEAEQASTDWVSGSGIIAFEFQTTVATAPVLPELDFWEKQKLLQQTLTKAPATDYGILGTVNLAEVTSPVEGTVIMLTANKTELPLNLAQTPLARASLVRESSGQELFLKAHGSSASLTQHRTFYIVALMIVILAAVATGISIHLLLRLLGRSIAPEWSLQGKLRDKLNELTARWRAPDPWESYSTK